jgi:hypothetical protein
MLIGLCMLYRIWSSDYEICLYTGLRVMQLFVSGLLQSCRAWFPGHWLKTLAVQFHAGDVNVIVKQNTRNNAPLVYMHFAIILLQRKGEKHNWM